MYNCVPAELKQIAQEIQYNCGHALLVGGCVRDSLLRLEAKDYDIEVYGMTMEYLINILRDYGKVNVVGQSFGVIKLSTSLNEYDFSLPRKENRIGVGHKDFSVEIDATMTPIEAAARRDFTINSMMMDPISGEIIDPFGGQYDIERGILKPTSEAFKEDALRILRGMQFAARFKMIPTLSLADMAYDMMQDYAALPKERVWGEWEKWALKGNCLSWGIEFLDCVGWIILYPQIHNLIGCKQDNVWHPEGDAYIHTLHVVDEMAAICKRDGIEGENRTVLMLAALCHDFGKPTCTEFVDGRIRSHGHEAAGIEPTRLFLESIGCFPRIIERVLPLVAEHLTHVHLEANGMNRRGVLRLARRLEPATIPELCKLIEADMGGRPPLPKGLPPSASKMLELAADCKVEKSGPNRLLTGKILIEMGVKPGVEMGKILKAAYEAQLDGLFDDEVGAVKWYCDKLDMIEMLTM